MELVELRNDERFVKQIKDEEDLLTSSGDLSEFTKIGQTNSRSVWKRLRVQIRIFRNEIFEEQELNAIVRQHSGMWTTTLHIQRAT